MRRQALGYLDELEGFGPRIERALAPHAIYTVSEELLRWAAEMAAERGLAIQIHLSETEQEVDDCIAAHGTRPAHYLDRLGVLSERAVLAHGVWLDDEELELIAERGATVVTNPGREHEARRRGRLPLPSRASCRSCGGARHRRRRLQRLARPLRRPEGLCVDPEARCRGPDRAAGSRGLAGGDGRRRPAHRWRGRAHSRSALRPTSSSCAATRRSSASAAFKPTSSTQPRDRWWTPRWSRDGC